MDHTEIQSILRTLGERVPFKSRLFLIGGSAMTLLGSPRPTMDIDFVGDDVHPNELQRKIMQIARELKIHVDPVPIEHFIPLPDGSEQRNIRMVNLETWMSMLSIRTALRSANWIAAWIPTLTTSTF